MQIQLTKILLETNNKDNWKFFKYLKIYQLPMGQRNQKAILN